jgi:ABC-type bacteriocin/lantibiotic exporter with double-glycine peptidase domain
MPSRRAPSFRTDDIEQADGALRACLRECGVDTSAEIPDNITDIEERIDFLCRPAGVMHRTVELTGQWYQQAFGAMLATLDTGQMVALLPTGVKGYCYHEPSTGRKIKIDAKIAQTISPHAVCFYRPLPAKKLGINDLMRFIAGMFDLTDYLLVLAAAGVVMLVSMLQPIVQNIAYGTVIPSGQIDLVLPMGAMLLGVTISTVLIGICRNLVMARVSLKLEVTTEAATFARVLSLPTSFFKEYSSGNLANRVSSMTMLVNEITSITLGTGLTAILSIFYLFQIGAYTPVLVIPAIIITLVQAVAIAV